MSNEYSLLRACIPWIIILILSLISYFSRNSKLKYLYLISIIPWIGIIISEFIIMNHPIWYNDPRPWMQAMPFIRLISWLIGVFMTIKSIAIFIITQAQKHLWAKITIITIKIIAILASIWFGYFVILGILSLKSG